MYGHKEVRKIPHWVYIENTSFKVKLNPVKVMELGRKNAN
jgi:hypothetical protein